MREGEPGWKPQRRARPYTLQVPPARGRGRAPADSPFLEECPVRFVSLLSQVLPSSFRVYPVRVLFLLGLLGVLAADSGLAQPSRAVSTDTSAFVGSWMGTLTLGGTDLRVVFHLEREADGRLSGTMDSPDQGATDLSISRVLVQADTLRLEVPSIAGAYAGVLEDDTRTLEGQWVQGGARLPLTLEKTEKPPTVRRPQEPTEPYPYATETVTFRNAEAGVTLEGTLSRPETDGPVPAVVLVAGAGPDDRDGTVDGHRPFFVLADAFTRRGLAVLRFDERGVGGSTGTQEGATMADLSADVVAAVEALSQRPDIDSTRLGLIGHGEGGLIAPLVTTRTDQVDFLVLLGTPGLPGDQILAAQLDRRIRDQGADRRTRALQRGVQQRIFEVLKQDADSATIASQLRRIMLETEGIRGEETITREIQRLMDPWLRFYISHDPRETLREVTVPVLAIAGGQDQQVAPDTNQAAIEQSLGASDAPIYTVQTLDSLNHRFQTVDDESPAAYGRIEETFAPGAIDVIVDWIDEHVGLEDSEIGKLGD